MPNEPPPRVDPEDELQPVANAFESVTGRRPSPATIARWRLKGLRGVRLSATVYLNRTMCSRRTAREFLNATNPDMGDTVHLAASRTNRAAQAAFARAERELIEAGG
jgi:hypothetical protein